MSLRGWDSTRGSDRYFSKPDQASEDPASQRTWKLWSTMRRDWEWIRQSSSLPFRSMRRSPTIWSHRRRRCWGGSRERGSLSLAWLSTLTRTMSANRAPSLSSESSSIREPWLEPTTLWQWRELGGNSVQSYLIPRTPRLV